MWGGSQGYTFLFAILGHIILNCILVLFPPERFSEGLSMIQPQLPKVVANLKIYSVLIY